MIKYDRQCNSTEYRLEEQSYIILAKHANFTPTADPYHPVSPVPTRPSDVSRHPPLPVSDPSHRNPVVRETRQGRHVYPREDWNTYSDPWAHRRPPLSRSSYYSPTPLPVPTPEAGHIRAVCALIVWGLGVAALGYGGYRLFRFGKWACRWVRGMWTACGDILLRGDGLQLVRGSELVEGLADAVNERCGFHPARLWLGLSATASKLLGTINEQYYGTVEQWFWNKFI